LFIIWCFCSLHRLNATSTENTIQMCLLVSFV